VRIRARIAFFALSLVAAMPLAATSLGAAGTTATTPPKIDPALAGFYGQKPVWRACGKGFDCTTARVPIDYTKPSGRTIKLALKRMKGTRGAARVGTLFFVPGGPGNSAVASMMQYGSILSERLGAAYDIVGLDPRGVGASKRLDCLTDAQLDAWRARPASPTTPVAKRAFVAAITGFGKGCLERAGELAAHVSTAEVAKDLDILRALVADRRLNYLGFSYGARIGSAYAHLFPKHVGRMVLDGVEHPRLNGVAAERARLRAYQSALRSYIRSCVAMSNCPLGATENAAMQRLLSLIKGLARRPLPAGDPRRPLTDSRAIVAIASVLPDPGRWESLTSALRSALQVRNGTELGRLGDMSVGRNGIGKYRGNGNELEASQAIKCLDSPSREGVSVATKALPGFRAISPMFGALWAWTAATCELWPIKATSPLPTVHPLGAPPILVVGTTRDNVTPYSQAVALAKALRTRALLTYEGDGHLAYLRASSTCIDNWVERYLVTGTTPPKDTRCAFLMGWQLTASNVGLAPMGLSCSSLSAYSGGGKPPAGTVIRQKRIPTALDLSNGNITIEKSCIQPTSLGPGQHIVSAVAPPSTVTIRDSEIDGSLLSAEAVSTSCAFRGIANLERNYVHGMGSGICFFGTGSTLSGSATNNYVTGLRAYGDPLSTGSHNESATIRDFPVNVNPNRTLVIRGNRLVSRSGNDTASLFIQTFAGYIDNVTVQDNLFDCDNWEVPLEAKFGNTYGTHMQAINNRFTPGGWGPGYVDGGPGWQTWSSNYMNDPTKPNHKGAPAPKPG
jgi:pimeloyl-ACP methyl ester carboxylesterase